MVLMLLKILMMSNFLYLRKGRFQMKPICGIYDWVILILVEFMVWLKVEF